MSSIDDLGSLDAWRLSEHDLATAIVRALETSGAIPATRGEEVDRLRRWVRDLDRDLRQRLCLIWQADREGDAALADTAAKFADVLMTARGDAPVAQLAIYLARFVGSRLCAGS